MNSTHLIFSKSCLLLVGLLLLNGGVHAQEGAGPCPEGMGYYGTSSGVPSCGPLQSTVQQPPARWADQWGAIATDADKGVLGAAINMPSQDQAKQTAMADCQAKGGAQCKIQLAYHNQCAAMVLGDKAFNVSSAATINEATQSGIKRCSADSLNCHVYYSACSLPKQIQ